MWTSLLVGLIVALVLLVFYYYFRLKKVKEHLSDLEFTYRSMAVKHGQHWEQFVPFTDAFAKVAKRENFVFIGMPIDGICFDDDGIKFIEVKTGKSQLNAKQRQVKNHVNNKQISWIELRF